MGVRSFITPTWPAFVVGLLGLLHSCHCARYLIITVVDVIARPLLLPVKRWQRAQYLSGAMVKETLPLPVALGLAE